MNFDEAFFNAHNWLQRVQFEMDTIHAIPVMIDEVSVLFSTPALLQGFVEWAESTGTIKRFNTVERDIIKPRNFLVRFEFLRLKKEPWRIEAMCILEGINRAPLHKTALRMGEGACVHASFKCSDMADYVRRKRELSAAGFGYASEHMNSYGQFCYMGVGPPYVKPRINLRD